MLYHGKTISLGTVYSAHQGGEGCGGEVKVLVVGRRDPKHGRHCVVVGRCGSAIHSPYFFLHYSILLM